MNENFQGVLLSARSVRDFRAAIQHSSRLVTECSVLLRDADTSLVQLRLSLDVVTCWHSFMFFLLSDAFVPASSEKIR